MTDPTPRSLGAILAVNRTVGIVLVSLLFFGLGEQLWSPFFPAYLASSLKTFATLATRVRSVTRGGCVRMTIFPRVSISPPVVAAM